jgi:ankyrin repeat protein
MRNLIICALFCGLVSSFGALAAEAPSSDELTRYFRSVQVDDAKTVLKLIEGRVVNPNQADPRSGETGLILALREGAPAVAAALIALPGLDLEAQAPNGNTALMMAAFKRNRPAVEALLAKGARVDRAGWNALHFAAAAGDDDITKLLLEKGASIDARAPAGFTALMLAAREGQESTVAALLAAGADPARVNSEQLTAAQIAERAEKPRIAAAIRRFTKEQQ